MKEYKTHRVKRLMWFENRVGQDLYQLSTILKQIKIESIAHAKALYLSQIEKKYQYSQIKISDKLRKSDSRKPQNIPIEIPYKWHA